MLGHVLIVSYGYENNDTVANTIKIKNIAFLEDPKPSIDYYCPPT